MNLSEAAADIATLSCFGTSSQLNRLLRLDFPFGDGPEKGVLLVNTMDAREELSRDFRIDLELLSDNAFISLKSMMGKMVTISLVRADGSLRYFNGYVTEFRLIKTDGGFAFYQMVLGPWLAFTKLRHDCVSFQNKSVIELTEATFEAYLERDCKTSLNDPDPKLSCANQYNETDYSHLHRRWEALGLHYWYEHRADGHTLWLADNTALAPWIDKAKNAEGRAIGEIEFRSESGAGEGDGIEQWQPARQIGSGSLTLTSFDYKTPRPQRAMAFSANRQGNVASRERFADTGAYGYRDRADGDALAARRMEELDSMTQSFHATGNDRNAQAGRSFRLRGHFSSAPPRMAMAERDYLIVVVDHHASNNYQAGSGAGSVYTNDMICVRQSVRWRPGCGYNSERCLDPGVQTALVVGPAGQEIHTDSLGRIKIQFHWDRAGQYDDASSQWVRVAMPVSGGQFGQIGLPRAGQEVVVQFLGGNVDHPLVTGVVYNSENMPPWQLPGQGALSGLRSRELGGGGRSNHLVLDDTAGALQAQLRSDHAHSQLSLGRIVRIEDNAGRKEQRGEGFELRSDAWGVVRAAKGLLITTEARLGTALHVKDMGETVRRLLAARDLHQAHAELSADHGVQDQKMQSAVSNAIAGQNEEIKGQGAQFPELANPHLLLASQGGIEASSGRSIHFASEEHTAITAGESLSIASGDSFFATIGNTLRLMVYKAGMKLVAAAGDIDIRALSHNLHMLAKLNITQNANCITITAKEELVINGGGSYGKFSAGGIEFGTNGTHTFHAANHSLVGAKNMPAELEICDIKAAKKTERKRQRPVSC
jgi:type VI secretion system secreted protein VgrG